ncbi:MAG: NarK family nitrate/nitrite MFS transporter [Gammaproteobacteria bacterium]
MSKHVINDWRPEDPKFWESTGKKIATRNLWISIPNLLLAFSVWMVWSMVAVKLNDIGFKFSKDELFMLTALPPLAGATLRIFYSFMVPIVGGRRWTAITTASLVIPAVWMGIAVQDPSTPYSTFVIIALLCGFGGGNFASSMANISFFYPKSQQGTALGLNAGLGNLGVSVMQFLIPVVIGMSVYGSLGGDSQVMLKDGVEKQVWLQNAGFVWIPFLIVAVLAAWFGMNDLASARSSFSEQAVIFKYKHNWLMCWLYIGTFGSFIGYSAGFAMLMKTQFTGIDPMTYAFLGPLVGALIRPVGGWLSDKIGGAKVTFWNFLVMIGAVFGVLHFLPQNGEGGNFWGFFSMFMVLFVTTGIGNGSTFRMIPVIFRTQNERAATGKGQAAQDAVIKKSGMESAAVLGFSSAIGAYGGFFIPKSFGTSLSMTGSADAALYGFIVFYVTCVVITWWFYSRKGAEVPC